ncbi:MAG: FliM/FliN family flagellar motor switch protein [Bryobacterales bacterium]|nr:FliM/FliN family flagellar motor switch protein [Bryobacterales bacterium]
MTPAERIAHLADVLMEVEVELDRKMVPIRDILKLEPGSVVKLSHSAGENISIVVGGRMIGSGEIVIIEDSMGIRITDFVGDE